MDNIKAEDIEGFRKYLTDEERSPSTVRKYIHDVESFAEWCAGREIDKSTVVSYKRYLCEKYAPSSVNAALSSLNSFFDFTERHNLRVKSLKMQRQIFASADRELTKAEYERLLCAASQKRNERLYLLMQTICSTGIRVSEVRYITAEAAESGMAEISCKGKRRQVFLPKQLCRILKRYIKEKKKAEPYS